jgi:prepilin-type N-terminal cleavage/methylation domain-containing protein
MRSKKASGGRQSGFTLIEAMISMVLLGGGLLALASALTQGMVVMSTAHYHQIAKEKAAEAMESVFTSRDARKVTNWDLIQNRSRNVNALFLDDPQPLRLAGNDGLVNTLDDGEVETEIDPGPNNVIGGGDDEVIVLNNFQREIEIRDIGTNIRRIRIIISYTIGSVTREYVLTSFITPFA